MKRICFSIFLILNSGLALIGYAQKTEWLTTIQPGGNEYVWDVCTDKSGNVLATGRVKFSSTFGWSPNTQTPAQYGAETDVFIAKYDADGNLIWVRREGGYEPDWGRSVATDNENSVYVAGDYCDTAFFGSDTIIALGAFQNRNAFFVKYDSAGNFLWSKTMGSADGHSRAYSVTVDTEDHSYVCGHTGGVSNFDSLFFGTANKTLPFFARFDPDGNCLWAKHIPVTTSGEANAVFYQNGFIYVTGMFKGTMIINGNSFVGNSTSWNDMFITKWDTLGNFVWAKTAIGQYSDLGNDVITDKDENVYVLGTFANDINFGTDTTLQCFGTSGNATIANNSKDIFIVKYDSSGTFKWVNSINSEDGLAGASLAYSATTNTIYISGGIADTTFFDQDTFYSVNNTLDIIISALDTKGKVKWNKVLGGTGNENGQSIDLTPGNDLIYGGYYQNTISFDTITTTALNGDDAYIGKIVPPLVPQINFSDTVACLGDSILFYAAQDGVVSYQWLENGNPVPSGNTDSTSIDFAVGGTHEIALVLSNYFDTDTIIIGNYLVYNKPLVSLGNDTTLCDGVSFNLDAGVFSAYSWSDGSTQQFLSISSGGMYWVSVADTNGCSNGDSISVAYFSPVSVSLGADTTLCDTLDLILDPGPFNTYLWSDNSTSSAITVNQSGIYAVEVTDVNQCTGTDTVVVAFENCLDVADTEFDFSVKTYPNPFIENFQLELGKNASGNLWIIDGIGRIVKTIAFDDQSAIRCDLDGFAGGVYYLKIVGGHFSGFSGTIYKQK